MYKGGGVDILEKIYKVASYSLYSTNMGSEWVTEATNGVDTPPRTPTGALGSEDRPKCEKSRFFRCIVLINFLVL